MKRIICLLSFILITSSVFCVGEAGAIFLLINPGSSAAGTGEAQVAKVNDAYASYYNPAGLAFLEGSEVVLQHVNWLPNLADDIFYDFTAYRKYVPGIGTFGGHFIYLNLGSQQGTDEFGFPTSEFKYTGKVATKVFPSPVFISAILFSCRITPPINCTSKCLNLIVLFDVSLTTAKASGKISSKVDPSAIKFLK